MAITYHAGRRIQATSSDIASTPAIAGGWKEVGRTTLGSAGDTIDVTSLSDKIYYMTLTSCLASGTINAAHQLNSDTGTNYASRYNVNGGSDATIPNASFMGGSNVAYATPQFLVSYYANISTKEKLFQTHNVFQNTAGAGTAPARGEAVGKHSQTTNPISAINAVNNDSGDFNTGSEVVVLGWDPADTHTTNFWEELASVDVTTGTSINSGTFAAKKYLWVQTYIDLTASNFDYRFNSDGTSSYSNRLSSNGGTDVEQTTQSYLFPNHGFGTFPHFDNMFIVNNAAKEKLIISNTIGQGTAGAGTAPQRQERVGKWINTSDQITDINVATTGNVNRLVMKVWGSN